MDEASGQDEENVVRVSMKADLEALAEKAGAALSGLVSRWTAPARCRSPGSAATVTQASDSLIILNWMRPLPRVAIFLLRRSRTKLWSLSEKWQRQRVGNPVRPAAFFF